MLDITIRNYLFHSNLPFCLESSIFKKLNVNFYLQMVDKNPPKSPFRKGGLYCPSPLQNGDLNIPL